MNIGLCAGENITFIFNVVIDIYDSKNDATPWNRELKNVRKRLIKIFFKPSISLTSCFAWDFGAHVKSILNYFLEIIKWNYL